MAEYPMNEIPIVEVFNKINKRRRRAIKGQVVCLIFKYWHFQGKTVLKMTGADIVEDHTLFAADTNQMRKEFLTFDEMLREVDECAMPFLLEHHKNSWFNYLFDMPIDVNLITRKMSMCWYIADFWLLLSMNLYSPMIGPDIRIFKERFGLLFNHCTEQERMIALVIDQLDILRMRDKMGIITDVRNERLKDGRRVIGISWTIGYDDEIDADEDKTDREYCRIIINNEWENMPEPKSDYSPSIPASRYGDQWIHMVSKYLLRPCDVHQLCKCCKCFETIDDEYNYNPYMLWTLEDFEVFDPLKKKYVRYEDAQNSFLLLDAKLCAKSYLVYRNLCNLWDLNERRKEDLNSKIN